jgi:flagellar biosynthesis/type III secretory pathway ATPase
MGSVVPADHLAAAQRIKALMAAHRSVADLIAIGAYKEGTDPEVDLAIRMKPRIDGFLRQPMEQAETMADSVHRLKKLLEDTA